MVKWLLVGLGGLLLLAIVFLVAVPHLVNTRKIQATIAHSAGQALGRPVRFASLSLSLLPVPALRLTDLQVAEDPRFGTTPFLAVEAARLGLRLWPLLTGRVEITELVLERPRVALIQAPGGRWNIASLGARPGGPLVGSRGSGDSLAGSSLLLISRVQVAGGTLSYEVRSRRGAAITYRLEGLSLGVSGVGLGGAIEFDGETRVVPGDVRVKIASGTFIPAGGRSLAESDVKADMELNTKDVAPLARALIGAAPRLAGPVQGKLVLSGTLAKLAARGELEFCRVTVSEHRPNCPEPKIRSLTLEAVRFPLTYAPFRLTSGPLSARLGGGIATVALTLDFAPHPFFRLSQISIRALPLAPVLEDYLCQGYAVSGPLDLTGELSARPGDLWHSLAGQGRLRIGAGRVVGPQALALVGGVARIGSALSKVLNLDLPQALFASPLEFDSITASYEIADGRLTTQDFLYSSSRLKVTAAGEYGLADGRMNLDLGVTSSKGRLSARVTGTAASPAIQVRTLEKIIED